MRPAVHGHDSDKIGTRPREHAPPRLVIVLSEFEPELFLAGERLPVSRTERLLLREFATASPHAVSREHLLERVWKEDRGLRTQKVSKAVDRLNAKANKLLTVNEGQETWRLATGVLVCIRGAAQGQTQRPDEAALSWEPGLTEGGPSARAAGTSGPAELARHLVNLVPSFLLHREVEEDALVDLLRDAPSPPHVYYHMRVGKGLHWVDFCNLVVLRACRRVGLPAVALLTPESHEPAAPIVTHYVTRLVGQPPEWHQDLRARATADYEKAAIDGGYGFGAEEAVLNGLHARGVQGNREALSWAKYIAVSSRHCILFAWHKSEVLRRGVAALKGVRSVIVETETLTLGGQPGKREEPGRDLFLEPPVHPRILSWCGHAPEADIRKLAHYLFMGLAPAPLVPQEWPEPWQVLAARLRGARGEAAGELAQALVGVTEMMEGEA